MQELIFVIDSSRSYFQGRNILDYRTMQNFLADVATELFYDGLYWGYLQYAQTVLIKAYLSRIHDFMTQVLTPILTSPPISGSETPPTDTG